MAELAAPASPGPAPGDTAPAAAAEAPVATAALAAPPMAAARAVPSSPVAYAGNPKPPYPVLARERGLEGRVVLRVEVAADGVSGTIAVAQSSGHAMLDRAAQTAVARWRFAPATVDGQKVAGAIDVPVVFRLID